MTRNELVDSLAGLKDEIRENYHAELKGIFGSRARGDERTDSDLDVLVAFKPGADLFDLVQLGDFLETRFNIKIDIVSERALRPELRGTILHEIIPV